MELTFEKSDLLKAVQVLQGVAATRNTLPILSNILIEAKDDKIEMSATDLEVGIKVSVPGTITVTGSMTVPARKLAEIVRELPPADVKLAVTANDRVEIECERGKYTLPGLSAEEFPPLLSMSDEFFTMSAATVIDMINKTSFAASTEESRYFLNGMYLHLTPEGTKAVATDGRRLAMLSIDPIESVTEEIGVIIPIKAINELKKTFADAEELKISIAENQIIFSNDEATLTSRLVEGEYPKYDNIIPQDNDIRVSVETKALLSVVKRVSLLANPKTLLIRLDFQESALKVSARAPDFGEAHEEMELKSGSANISVGFSAKFAEDVLTHIDTEEVSFNLKDSLSAVLINPAGNENFLCLIMPMRLE